MSPVRIAYETTDGRWRIVKPDATKPTWIVQERLPSVRAGESVRWIYCDRADRARDARTLLDRLVAKSQVLEVSRRLAVGHHRHVCGHPCECETHGEARCIACEVVRALTSYDLDPVKSMHVIILRRYGGAQ